MTVAAQSTEPTVHALGTVWPPGQPLWVFGYGSIIYRVDFPVESKVAGFIRGRRRAFLQESHDHRGTEENPGRVCTLIPAADWPTIFAKEQDFASGDSQEDVCWGVAYKVASGMEAQVKAHLDHREKDGYSIDFVDVFGADGQVAQRNVMVYVGVCTNPSFTRAPALDYTAAVIARAAGPSGSNREYLYKLCDALRALHPLALDPYLCRLEAMVRALVDE